MSPLQLHDALDIVEMSMTFRLSFGSAAMHVIQNVDDTCSLWITCVAAEDAKQMDAGDGASGDAGDGCQC